MPLTTVDKLAKLAELQTILDAPGAPMDPDEKAALYWLGEKLLGDNDAECKHAFVLFTMYVRGQIEELVRLVGARKGAAL